MQRRRWWIAIESIQLTCSQYSDWVLSILLPHGLLLRVHKKTNPSYSAFLHIRLFPTVLIYSSCQAFPYNFVASPPTLLAQTKQEYIKQRLPQPKIFCQPISSATTNLKQAVPESKYRHTHSLLCNTTLNRPMNSFSPPTSAYKPSLSPENHPITYSPPKLQIFSNHSR